MTKNHFNASIYKVLIEKLNTNNYESDYIIQRILFTVLNIDNKSLITKIAKSGIPRNN